MSDFDELMRVYGLDERMFALGRLSKKERDKSRTALADAISAVTSERDALKAKLDARNKVTENIISDDLSDKIIANWREYYSKLPLERQTGGDLFIQKCLNAIESLRWSFDECMRQYDIQQERACNAEAKIDGYKLMMQSETLEKLDKPELIMIIRDLRGKEYESRLAEADKENKRLLEAINNIADLGLQRLPVDKRWGTAFAIAREVLHRARLAKDAS
jgi:hypothetical protein